MTEEMEKFAAIVRAYEHGEITRAACVAKLQRLTGSNKTLIRDILAREEHRMRKP